MIAVAEAMGIECTGFRRKAEDPHADPGFAMELSELIHTCAADAVFSFNYFPLLSEMCEINHIPYIAWIYDCPDLLCMSGTIGNDQNIIYCFDRLYTERLIGYGAKHCFHLPLSPTVPDMDERWMTDRGKQDMNDICFVGSLYNGASNRVRHTEAEPFIRGYLDGLMGAQGMVYGYNLI